MSGNAKLQAATIERAEACARRFLDTAKWLRETKADIGAADFSAPALAQHRESFRASARVLSRAINRVGAFSST